jgi:hypothetical protein
MESDLDVKLSNFLLNFQKEYGINTPDANELINNYDKAFDFYNNVFSKKISGSTYDEFANYFNTPIPKNRNNLPKVSPDAIQGALDAYRSAQGDKQYLETQKAMQFSKENPEVLKTPDSKSDKFKQSVQRGFKVIGSDLANSFINSAYGLANIYESAVSIQDAIVSGDKVAESNLKSNRLLLEKHKKDLQKLLGTDVSQKERDAFYAQAGMAGEVLSVGASQASMFTGGGAAEALKIASGSKVAGSIGFALGFQNGLEAINSSESGRNLPEKYKTMYAGLVATTEMVTEAVPFNATLGKKMSKKLINPIIDKTISNIVSKGIKEITPEIFEQEANIVSKKLLNRVSKVGSNVAKAVSEEFPSEFLSSASNDILNKYINKESGQKIFEEKSWGDIVHDATRNGALGAIFAGGLSGALSVGSPKINKHIIQTLTENKSSDGSFDIGRQKLLDEYVQTQQELGKDTSVEQLDNVINGYIDKLNKTPKDLTPIQQQAVLSLTDDKNSALQKKEELEKEKDGLDIPFQKNIQQQIDAITTNIDNLDNQIGELPSMDDSEIEKNILSDISGIEMPYTEKIKSIKSNQQNETEIGIQEAGTQGNENVQNAVQVSGEKRREDVNKQVEEKLPISEQVAIPEAEQQIEGVTPLIQQEDGKERNKKGRKENVLTATSQEEVSAPQTEKVSGVENISDRAKNILDKSLSEYNNASDEDKSKMVSDIKDKLSVNEKGVSNIGIGLDKDMVSAGNEFLNTITKQEVKPTKKESNAVQEQISSKSVLLEEGQAMELRPVDEGNKKPEVVAEQSQAVKEEVTINGEKKTVAEGDNVIVSHAGNDVEGVIVKDKDGNLQVEQKYSYRGNQKTKYSLDAIKEFVEEQVKDITKEQVKEPTTSKKIAGNIRKGKINKKGNVYANTPFSLAWDSALELIAQSIEKGGKVIDAINKGIEAFKKSDWYKNATKEDKEIETANLENELKIKYADSLLDTIYLSDIKKDPIYQAKKELIDTLKDLRNTFKDSVVAFDKINKIYGNVNRLPKLIESISNIRDEKSFEKAREQSLKYVQDLVSVTKQRYVEQLKKSLKNKIAKTKIDNAALKELNRLNPFKLNNEEIDTMTDMLGTIKDQLNGKKEGLIPNKDIISFVNKVQERLKEEQLDKVKKEVIEKTKVKEPEDLTVLNANISALKEDIRINADSYSAYEKKQVDKILSIDVNNISNKKDLSLLIANIVANKEYHGLYDILKQDNVHKITKNIETLVKGVKLGSNIGTKFTSQSLQIKNFFNDPKKGAKFAVETGVHQLNSGEALAYKARTKAIESIDTVLKNNGFKNGIQDRTVEMSYTTGVLAYLRRDSSEKGRFDNVKNLIKDSISILKKGTDEEILEANAIESVYNKYVDSAENVDEVYDKIKLNSETKDDSGRNAKGALLIYDTLLSNFDERYDTYDIVTQASQGKKLKKVENYIPIRYKSVFTTLEATSIPEVNVMEMMASDINSQSNVSEATSGTMKEENMPNKLEKGGVVLNLDVLDGALDAIQEQVYDIETLETRTTLNYLFNNKKIKESLGVKLNEMLGGDWDVMGIEGVSNYRAFQKGVVSSVKSHLGIYNTKEDNDILDEANRAIANFSRAVIYNPKQIPLQTLPLGLDVTINTMPSFGFKDFRTAAIVAKSIALNKDSFVLSNSSILLRSAPELILQARAATKKLNAEFDSIIKKRIKGISNTLNTPTEWLANKTIETPDNLIARFSWMMYYLEYKKKNGEKNLDKNWNLEPRDIDAESYAEMMVSNTQGVNSQSTAAKFWKDKNGWQYLRNALFMFSGFSMNESANIKSDIRILAFGSNEQRKSAGLRISASLSSIALYYGMYSGLSLAGDYIWDSISDFLFGDDDEENKELKEKFDKLMNLKENIKSNVLSVANLIFFEGLGSEISSYSRELTDIIFGTSLADYKASTKYDSEYMKFISRIPGAYKEPFKAGYYIIKGGQYAFAGETSGEVLKNRGKYIQEVKKEIDNQDRVLGGAVLLAEVASMVGAMPANVRNAGRNYLKQTFPKNEAVKESSFNVPTKGAEKGEKRPNPEYVK